MNILPGKREEFNDRFIRIKKSNVFRLCENIYKIGRRWEWVC